MAAERPIRELTIAGRGFVLGPPPVVEYVASSWCSTYRRISPYRMPLEPWLEGQRRVIRDLLPHVHALTLPDAPHTIQAWICGTPGVLHYVFVAFPLRRLGIARAMVEAVCGTKGLYTHHKPKELARAFMGFTYSPYALLDAVRRSNLRRTI